MLKAHLDAVERKLLQDAAIPANAGHMAHRGGPREAFIKGFLQGHLSAKLAVGTGELIDADSLPRQPRNQFDIVIYKAEYPRIDIGGGIHAFLSESVVATIEVKSLLNAQELAIAVQSASNAKRLTRNLVTAMTSGYVPPGILSYVVAYDGPAKMATVHRWLSEAEKKLGLNQDSLPTNGAGRIGKISESVEGIFVLGKGSIIHDNSPIGLISDDIRSENPLLKRTLIDSQDGNLLWLFLLLTQAGSNLMAQWPNLVSYLQRVRFQHHFVA